MKNDQKISDTLDQPILNNLPRGWAKLKGEIGIEFELEGTVGPIETPLAPLWVSKKEGSLRGGYEYITAKPTPIKNIEAALVELSGAFSMKKYKPKDSLRCSTHIHISQIRKTVRQVYRNMLAYYLLEDLFVSTQGKNRIGNLFCLRLTDAQSLVAGIKKSLEDDFFFDAFNEGNYRYAAQNLCAVNKFGSLEYRFMKGNPNPLEALPWVHILYDLSEKSSKINLQEFLLTLEKQGPQFLFDFFFTKGQQELFLKNRTREDIENSVFNHFDDILMISRIVETEKRRSNFFLKRDFDHISDDYFPTLDDMDSYYKTETSGPSKVKMKNKNFYDESPNVPFQPVPLHAIDWDATTTTVSGTTPQPMWTFSIPEPPEGWVMQEDFDLDSDTE